MFISRLAIVFAFAASLQALADRVNAELRTLPSCVYWMRRFIRDRVNAELRTLPSRVYWDRVNAELRTLPSCVYWMMGAAGVPFGVPPLGGLGAIH